MRCKEKTWDWNRGASNSESLEGKTFKGQTSFLGSWKYHESIIIVRERLLLLFRLKADMNCPPSKTQQSELPEAAFGRELEEKNCSRSWVEES